MKKTLTLVTGGALGLLTSLSLLAAPTFPDRAITIVVPYAAGGASDTAARLVADQMVKDTDYTIIIQNKPGAGGSIAANYVAAAKPDGYTLLLGATNTNGINTYVYPQLSYDAVTSFKSVGMMAETVVVLLANSSFPADTLDEAIDLIAKNPGKYSYASPGIGSVHHLAVALLNKSQDLELLHVPYKGAGPAMVDLIADIVPLMIGGIAPARPYLESGQVKVLGVANDRQFNSLPEGVQYFSEIDEDTAVSSWLGLLAPANTPDEVVAVLSQTLKTALDSTELQSALELQGLQAQYLNSEQFEKDIIKNMPFWKNAVDAADLDLE